MWNRLEPTTVIVCKGMALLLFIVTLGVTHVEKQLNDLTRRQDSVQVLNLRRDPLGQYTFSIFGNSVSYQARYVAGHIETGDREVRLRFGGKTITIPTQAVFEWKTALPLVEGWTSQFLSEAEHTQQFFEKLVDESWPVLSKRGEQEIRKVKQWLTVERNSLLRLARQMINELLEDQ